MRPPALIVVVLLSAAAVWLESAAIITRAPFDFDDTDATKPWPRPVPSTWPSQPYDLMTCETTGISADWYTAEGATPQDRTINETLYRLIELRVGWPLRTFTFERTLVMPDARGTIGWLTDNPTSLWEGGLEIPSWIPAPDEPITEAPQLRRIPIHPIWPAFLFTTAAHAALFTVLAKLPALARRRYRRSKGRCPSCSYSHQGLALETSICPECGNTFR